MTLCAVLICPASTAAAAYFSVITPSGEADILSHADAQSEMKLAYRRASRSIATRRPE